MKSCLQLSLLGIGLSLVFSIVDGFGVASSQSFGADTASRVLNNKSMDLTGNVANLIILIPNEGHESPEMPEEQRLINQPYVPQNVVVNTGTNVVWFNGDVDHDHKITLVDENSSPVFESGEFKFNTLSKPLLLNDTGKFSYSESDVSQDDPKFVMEGTITTVYNNISQSGKAETNNSSNGNYDTVTLLMVPAKDVEEHVSNLQNQGLGIVSQYTFKDLRGGQKGTGPEQTLLVLGSKEKSLDNLLLILEELTPKLPYN